MRPDAPVAAAPVASTVAACCASAISLKAAARALELLLDAALGAERLRILASGAEGSGTRTSERAEAIGPSGGEAETETPTACDWSFHATLCSTLCSRACPPYRPETGGGAEGGVGVAGAARGERAA